MVKVYYKKIFHIGVDKHKGLRYDIESIKKDIEQSPKFVHIGNKIYNVKSIIKIENNEKV